MGRACRCFCTGESERFQVPCFRREHAYTGTRVVALHGLRKSIKAAVCGHQEQEDAYAKASRDFAQRLLRRAARLVLRSPAPFLKCSGKRLRSALEELEEALSVELVASCI